MYTHDNPQPSTHLSTANEALARLETSTTSTFQLVHCIDLFATHQPQHTPNHTTLLTLTCQACSLQNRDFRLYTTTDAPTTKLMLRTARTTCVTVAFGTLIS